MPSITIWPPPRLTRPSRDSPLVTNAPVLESRAEEVDDSSNDSPSPDADPDEDGAAGEFDDASERDAVRGTGGNDGTVTGGAGLFAPPIGALGVVTPGIDGVVTGGAGVGNLPLGGVGTGTGTGTGTAGLFGSTPRTPCHFAFQPASACRSLPSNPTGVANLMFEPPGALGPLNAFEASEACAVALYSLAFATA